MKLLKPEEPTVDAAVSYFLDMANGKTDPSKSNGQNGLGAVRHPSTYHVIPSVKLVTPTAQALVAAKDELEEEGEVIRGWKNQESKRGLDCLLLERPHIKERSRLKNTSHQDWIEDGSLHIPRRSFSF